MNFKSDNIAPVHPHIFSAMQEANTGMQNAYGHDEYSQKLNQKISDIFETQAYAFLVSTGSIANCLALSALCAPYQLIYGHSQAHINTHEAGLAESMGYKIIPVAGSFNKINIQNLSECIALHKAYAPHMGKPGAISITQPTEIGTVYTPDDIAELAQFGLPIHMDGARFTNALVHLGVSPQEMVKHIDVLSLGATKNGAMVGECVVFFNKELAQNFEYRVKRSGQLISKMRYLSAQMLAYFDVWLDNAKHANDKALEVSHILSSKYQLAYPVETNQVFVHIPETERLLLRNAGVQFYDWEKDICRFVTHFMTSGEEVSMLRSVCS